VSVTWSSSPAALVLLAAGLAAAKGPSPLVARVNGEAVSQAELQLVRAGALGARDAPEQPAALREVIHRRLLLQEARRRDLAPTDDEVDGSVVGLRRRFADLESFGRWLGERGLDESSLFEAVRDELMVARLKEQLVAQVGADDEQVRAYFAAHREELRAGDEVRLQIIAVKREADGADAMKALAKGARFDELARWSSQGKRAQRGGDVGWVSAETLPAPLREMVQGLKPGSARGPIRRGDEWLVVRLTGRRTGRAMTLEEARPEISRRLRSAKQQVVLLAWLAVREAEAKIELFPQP
jgi:parvulin-like peptidyl-prolyl isomerase